MNYASFNLFATMFLIEALYTMQHDRWKVLINVMRIVQIIDNVYHYFRHNGAKCNSSEGRPSPHRPLKNRRLSSIERSPNGKLTGEGMQEKVLHDSRNEGWLHPNTGDTNAGHIPPNRLSFNEGIPNIAPDIATIHVKETTEIKSYHGRIIRHHHGKPLAKAWAISITLGMPLLAAALTLTGQELRIGSGITAITSAVSLIPLRRDGRAGFAVLISMYFVSLIGAALFLILQCRNITHHRGRYIFGTLVLTGHFVVGLSQTSDSALDGILDFGLVVLPVAAAAFSLVFQRRRSIIIPRAGHSISQEQEVLEEADIGMMSLPVDEGFF
ncbi:hypothetical protein F4806DRAFT_456349 [Annulohypoxylon nitens]|nr:hypothetical protein F4806DRAFT_456349 [Annulohypoxylon nitens]